MLAVQVRLLAGRYVATQFNERDRAEWPPHPARLFAAAVAAWADTDEPDLEERAALYWWESLGPPQISCSLPEETAARSVVTHFVPVNDATVLSRDASGAYADLTAALELEKEPMGGDRPDLRAHRRAQTAAAKAQARGVQFSSSGRAPETGLGVLPENRVRQARTFPSITPADEIVTFSWPDIAPEPAQLEALDRVLGRIARLGHSSSPVDVAIVAKPTREASLVPAESGEFSVRTPTTGQLDSLIASYAGHQGLEPRTLPTVAAGYRRNEPAPVVRRGIFDDQRWLLFGLHPRCALTQTEALTRALRAGLMKHAAQPVPPMISGHRPGSGGSPTEPALDVHAAYLALPYVGSEYADGSVHALAVVLPRDVSPHDRAAVALAAARWQEDGGRLWFERGRTFHLHPLRPQDASVTARPSTWTRPATRWSTVTPVALDRHPGDLDSPNQAKRDQAEAEARESVMGACRNIGLPEPVAIDFRNDPPIRGTRPLGAFPPFLVGAGKLRKRLVHIDLTFGEPVSGPVLLGTGRFLGYGLFWPHPGSRS
ncbi:type I-U CRISPR-associated protein Csb2 [Micropruina sp.]|uniref:type I-G CRISPR-associated protein Csb2 n=1 Tax=Micropruina sp. TaxID=2737536 RepID=UPI0039E427AA